MPLQATLVSNYKSGYTDNGGWVTENHLLHNLTVSYDFNELFGGVTLQGRVRNLLDEDAPYFPNSLGYDDDNHSPYGRQFELTVRASF